MNLPSLKGAAPIACRLGPTAASAQWRVQTHFLTSSSCAGRLFFHLKGHSSGDHGATARLGLDGQLAAHQVRSFPHADEPQAVTIDNILLVKANSLVIHAQLYLFRCCAQFDSELPLTAVLNCILQSFL